MNNLKARGWGTHALTAWDRTLSSVHIHTCFTREILNFLCHVCYVITSWRKSNQYTNGFAYNCQQAQLTNGLTHFLEHLSENGVESATPYFQVEILLTLGTTCRT